MRQDRLDETRNRVIAKIRRNIADSNRAKRVEKDAVPNIGGLTGENAFNPGVRGVKTLRRVSRIVIHAQKQIAVHRGGARTGKA